MSPARVAILVCTNAIGGHEFQSAALTRSLANHVAVKVFVNRIEHNKLFVDTGFDVQLVYGMLLRDGWGAHADLIRRCVTSDLWEKVTIRMIRVDRKLNSTDVLDALTDLFILRGPPEYIRSDNGPEFIAQKVRDWIVAVGAKTAYIEPGSPWKNGYCESFNARFRDKLLNGELFYSLKEAQILIEKWRIHYNTVRPHSSLGYRPPVIEPLHVL